MARTDVGQQLPRDIGILLMPGFSMLAFFAILEPIRLANQLLGRAHYSWRVFTRDGTAARASCGIAAAGNCLPEVKAAPNCLIVIAGFDPWPQNDRQLMSWLRKFDRRGAVLGAVDTGSFLLASAGLLDNVLTSLHWESAAAFSELFPNIPLSEKPYELHARRILCAGGAAVLDMILEMLENEHGSWLGDAIASRLMLERRRKPAAGFGTTSDIPGAADDLHQIIRVMEQHIEVPIRISDVASLASLSQRSLERKCHRAMGRTPQQVYLSVRLKKARQILRHSNLAVREVALACGFTSVSYFCRAYKSRYQIQPGSDRTIDETLAPPSSSLASAGNAPANLGNGR